MNADFDCVCGRGWACGRWAARLLSSRPEHIGALHLEESSTLAQEFHKVGDENGFVEWCFEWVRVLRDFL